LVAAEVGGAVVVAVADDFAVVDGLFVAAARPIWIERDRESFDSFGQLPGGQGGCLGQQDVADVAGLLSG
jgi:hypothetical protein